MMTDKLENLIKDNRGSFDDLTPPGDMWDRISRNQEKVGRRRNIVIYRISSAAAVLIIALIGYTYLFTPKNQVTELSDFQKEILETEQYYNSKLMLKKQQVFKLTSNKPDIKTDIEEELALLDSALMELKNDLNDNIANAEVVEAMIQNYRMKLQILEDILMYLEPVEDEKPKVDHT